MRSELLIQHVLHFLTWPPSSVGKPRTYGIDLVKKSLAMLTRHLCHKTNSTRYSHYLLLWSRNVFLFVQITALRKPFSVYSSNNKVTLKHFSHRSTIPLLGLSWKFSKVIQKFNFWISNSLVKFNTRLGAYVTSYGLTYYFVTSVNICSLRVPQPTFQ